MLNCSEPRTPHTAIIEPLGFSSALSRFPLSPAHFPHFPRFSLRPLVSLLSSLFSPSRNARRIALFGAIAVATALPLTALAASLTVSTGTILESGLSYDDADRNPDSWNGSLHVNGGNYTGANINLSSAKSTVSGVRINSGVLNLTNSTINTTGSSGYGVRNCYQTN
ncbi:hypothetical protein AGMMS50256_39610 [Betaproteobacteria bacterium]|nr:hypothetical protein AGMMS50256_39610 [Betaproteobacteria bacterium]